MRLRFVLSVALLAAGLGACSVEDPYTGEPFAQNKRVRVRRDAPTKEELDTRPAPAYEDVLRAQEAEKARLQVPTDIEHETRYYDDGVRGVNSAVGPAYGPAHDPWASYEEDRRRVLVREWSDTGKPEPIAPEPKRERVVEDDPYAPAPKIGPKKDDSADSSGDKPDAAAGGDEKKADAPAAGGDEKKADAPAPADGDKKDN